LDAVVVGAGVVGLSTAHALHRAGASVRVIDVRPGPAQGTSYANAGGLCPSFAGPWAAPGMVRKALGWLLSPAAPLKIRPRPDPAQWRWLLRFALECDATRSASNKRAMQAIAHYSYACLDDVVAETGIAFDHARAGILQTFRSPATETAGRRAAEVLAGLGIAHHWLRPEEVAQVEPGLDGRGTGLRGALHFPDDGTGDARAFTQGLAAWLEAQGVAIDYGVEVHGLRVDADRLRALRTTGGEIETDCAVLATGPFAARLAPEVPLYPVKGYSLTYAGLPASAGPASSVMDEDSKIMFTRLGSRLRIGGVAELDGLNPALRPRQIETMSGLARRLFPGATTGDPELWAGFRAMTPDGRPRIGPSRATKGLWLNLGHGSNGWTQAAGAGRFLADLITGRTPALDPAAYAP
jgi:D-amino-acid dehydrogenase